MHACMHAQASLLRATLEATSITLTTSLHDLEAEIHKERVQAKVSTCIMTHARASRTHVPVAACTRTRAHMHR